MKHLSSRRKRKKGATSISLFARTISLRWRARTANCGCAHSPSSGERTGTSSNSKYAKCGYGLFVERQMVACRMEVSGPSACWSVTDISVVRLHEQARVKNDIFPSRTAWNGRPETVTARYANGVIPLQFMFLSNTGLVKSCMKSGGLSPKAKYIPRPIVNKYREGKVKSSPEGR